MKRGRPRRPFGLDGWIAAVLLLAAGLVPGCGGGSGGSSALLVLGAVAEGVGSLPQIGVFLNSRIRVDFNLSIDPESVNSQTFRVLVGPEYQEMAVGSFVVLGRSVYFAPALPQTPSSEETGFAPDTSYRMVLRAYPELHTIRSRSGKQLARAVDLEFRTRVHEPYFHDTIPGPPFVTGVMLDLDGNGSLDGDGDPETPDPEEFFAEDFDFGSLEPFFTGLRPGSSGLPPPNAPLVVGFLFSEPLDPASVFADREDPNGDGVPDGDGRVDFLACENLDDPYLCDVPQPGDICPKPLPFAVRFSQSALPSTDRYRVVASLEFPFALQGLARHVMHALEGLEDFGGDGLLRGFSAVFEVGEELGVEDRFVEDFSTRDHRDDMTTALWNAFDSGFLQAGLGLGGDGSDGNPVDPSVPLVVLDTRQGSGIFNFSELDFQGLPNYTIKIVGDKPAIVRVYSNVVIPEDVEILVAGSDGASGVAASTEARPGGLAGPGGYPGGSSSLEGEATESGEDGGAPPDTDGAGKGGLTGAAPGGGGGGAHLNHGQPGEDGQGAPGTGGAGGTAYGTGTGTVVFGGAGGGAGGNITFGVPGPSSGGAGGGGGGLLVIECLGYFQSNLSSLIDARGGAGGRGAPSSGANSGGGGGGAGGTIYIRAMNVTSLRGNFRATGGVGGTAGSPAGDGGNGSSGLIRVEDLDGVIPGCTGCTPGPFVGQVPFGVRGNSFGRSRFVLTNTPPGGSVTYRFDGSDPASGNVRIGPDVTDLRVVGPEGEPITALPQNAAISVHFRGAFEDPRQPYEPDLGTVTDWVTDVGLLSGYPMIQYEVRCSVGSNIEDDPPQPGVDDLRIRFLRE